MPAIWSVAIFAHNEAATLAETVRSAQFAGEGASTEIVILANGCRDNTVEIARDLAQVYRNIHVIEIALGDKANAWNHYVHDISAQLPFCDAWMHVFMDGDVQVSAPSFGAFATAFDLCPSAHAVGALPIAGRDQAAWRQRMTVAKRIVGYPDECGNEVFPVVANGNEAEQPFVVRLRFRGKIKTALVSWN